MSFILFGKFNILKSISSLLLLVIINSSRGRIIFPIDEPDVDIENFGECSTPILERGYCVNLLQCGDLFELLQKKPLFADESLFLSRSQCGYYNNNVLICCPPRSIKPGVIIRTPIPDNETSGRSIFEPTEIPSRNSGLLPTAPECGDSLQGRIYGGEKTKIDEFPWMVLLEYTKPGNRKGFHCGGSLINSRYVLTASHCVNGKVISSGWSLTSVRLGEWDLSTERDCEDYDCSDPVLDIPIERLIPHEQYNPETKENYNDIALIRLSRQVQYSDWIKPICLPSATHLRNENFDDVSFIVAGWGKTEFTSFSKIKQMAVIDGVNMNECNQSYSRINVTLSKNQLCAGGEKGIDSCRGDSGGPLIGVDMVNEAYYYQAAIISFGVNVCGSEGWPGVYTKIGPYLDWIESHISP